MSIGDIVQLTRALAEDLREHVGVSPENMEIVVTTGAVAAFVLGVNGTFSAPPAGVIHVAERHNARVRIGFSGTRSGFVFIPNEAFEKLDADGAGGAA